MKLAPVTLFVVSCLFPFAATAEAGLAQVTTDGTTSTTVTPTDAGVQIDEGDRAGDNLYHSFGEFSIPTGTEAFFNNASDIANIFSRVTGGNISNIDGLIRANGTANLFLINPAGIVFGEGASLQLGGSFYGSTADSIVFPDGEFSATDLDNPPLITVNAPIGLGFRDNLGEITVRGNGNGIRLPDSEVIDTQEALRVGTENTIGLIGGNLILENATIKTAGGSIELGSVAGGDVDLVETAKGFTFDYSGIENFSDISLTGISVVDASGLGGGNINVVGNNISLTGISGLTNYTLGGNPGGDTNVFAAESLEINGIENELNFFSSIANYVLPQGTADGGDINIEAQNLRIGDRGVIETFAFGQGNAGDININASESVSLASEGNGSAIGSSVDTNRVGDGGDVSITTPNLTLSNGAILAVSTSGTGDGGSLIINTDNFLATNGSEINASTFSSGNAGDIQITATDIELNGGENGLPTGLSSAVANPTAEGNGGDVMIETQQLRLVNGGAILVSTIGGGDGGDLRIQATDISLEHSIGAFTIIDASTLAEGTEGAGGSVTIETENLNLIDGGVISVANVGTGDGGSLIINTDNLLSTNGSAINADTGGAGDGGDLQITANNIELNGGENGLPTIVSTEADSTIAELEGNAGDVTIETQQLRLVNGGQISVGTSGVGDAGDVQINANQIDIIEAPTGESLTGIATGTLAEGAGGSVTIETENLNLIDGGQILASTFDEGDAGGVTINANDTVSIKGFGTNNISGIFAQVEENGVGDAGNIEITTANLSLADGGQVSSSTFGEGDAGGVTINANETVSIKGVGENNLPSGIFSNVAASGRGNAGELQLTTANLSIADGGTVSSSVFGEGNGVRVTINSSETVSIEGVGTNNFSSGIFATVEPGEPGEPGGRGNAGNIELTTANLFLADGAQISSSTFGEGNAGGVTINASETVSIEGVGTNNTPSNISAEVRENGIGTAGELQLTTPNLSIADGGTVNSSTSGEGDAGNIFINVSDSLTLTDSGSITTSVAPEAVGDGGNITIGIFQQQGDDLVLDETQFTPEITLSDEGIIAADSEGDGAGGSITVRGADVNLNQGQISATTASTISLEERDDPSLSEINLFVDENLTLRNNSNISTEAGANANAADINIDAEFIIAYPSGGNGDGNDIIASAEQGQGGAISIRAESLLGIEERRAFDNNGTNDIDASSGTEGLDGTVSIETPDNNPLRETTELSDNVVTAEPITTSDVCSASDVEDASSLAVQGKGGVAPEPTAPFSGDALIVNGEEETSDVSQNNGNHLEPDNTPPNIQPVAYKDNGEPVYLARGVIKQANGTVILTTAPNQNTTPRTPANPYSCY